MPILALMYIGDFGHINGFKVFVNYSLHLFKLEQRRFSFTNEFMDKLAELLKNQDSLGNILDVLISRTILNSWKPSYLSVSGLGNTRAL